MVLVAVSVGDCSDSVARPNHRTIRRQIAVLTESISITK